MDTALIKDFFDCCRDAKKILELLPPLPQGLTPRHIQIIDTISQLDKFLRAHGIAVRQTIEQRIGQIIQNVPNENARCNLAFPLSKEIGKCFDTAR